MAAKFKMMSQVGMIVPDVYATIKNWEKFFGITEEDFYIQDTRTDEISWEKLTFRGKPTEEFNLVVAIVNRFGMQFELIQQVEPEVESMYTEFLAQTNGVGGVHHISFVFEDMEGAMKHIADLGYDFVCTGEMNGGPFYFWDTVKDLGLNVETLPAPDVYWDFIKNSQEGTSNVMEYFASLAAAAEEK